ncbi:hypothetical protein TWF694_001063 [Orbilia ellipsospora]|uniref:Uncharacterized protein n=1 Tax=Orbilia ellipsospora TaxID=2528407 RepID=A0AAV9XS38_9PEZI
MVPERGERFLTVVCQLSRRKTDIRRKGKKKKERGEIGERVVSELTGDSTRCGAKGGLIMKRKASASEPTNHAYRKDQSDDEAV